MDLADRMKHYESITTEQILMPTLPFVARIDGRAFHTFTRNMEKPYDNRFCELMKKMTMFMAEEFNACFALTHSDELSLIWHYPDYKSEPVFAGKVFKLNSILASTASVYFNAGLGEFLPEKNGNFPVFDCRIWSLPDQNEVANYIIWRELDALRNSVSLVAQSLFSVKELFRKSSDDMQEMMFQKHGINYNDYPVDFKRGVKIQRKQVSRCYTEEEINQLPLKHKARTQPDFAVERQYYEQVELPIFTKIENKIDVIFNGAEAKTKPANDNDVV